MMMNPDRVSAQVRNIGDGFSELTKASTTEVRTITSRKMKKSNAQRCREYREKKKLQNKTVQNITAERSDGCSGTDQLLARKPKTDAERRRKYYEAQKLKKQIIKKIPKTAKQRNKECYDRKKNFLAFLDTLLHHSDVREERLTSWKSQNVRDAVKCVLNGCSYLEATRITGVTYGTIRKFYKEYVLKPGLKETYRRNPNLLNVIEDSENETTKNDLCEIFTHEQEMSLIKCIQTCEHLFFGLTDRECCMLAYQMVVNEDMKIPEGWQNGMATKSWLISFKTKHVSIMKNIEKPDLKQCARHKKMIREGTVCFTWEKIKANDFYDKLEEALKKIPDHLDVNNRVFSLDEIYVSTSPRIRHYYEIRDSNNDIYTACCIICANGTSLPPLIIKPYADNEPARSAELKAPRGRLTPDHFIEVIQYFVKNSQTTPSNPSILIMDTDADHLSSAALDLASESGVLIVTLHTHLSKLLQPLNDALLDSFYRIFNYAISFMTENKPDYFIVVSRTINEIWAQVASSESVQNAFKKCGIHPFDRDLFTDADYEMTFNVQDQACYECRVRDKKLFYCKKKNNIEMELDYPKIDEAKAGGESLACQDVAPAEANEQTEDNDEDMSKRSHASQELDKLKRRLIRSIARLIKEKKTEEDVWEDLKKECGTNCKTLWLRMRSLTLKKLKRLLDADDRIEIVPVIARMTLTDWLLYDLVLVHEKIDVINRGSQKDSKVLENLFSLVQMFEIEGRVGDDLAEAWTAATIAYNAKGHQCSPMLMQRRWYQIKELTRHKINKFWYTYRGNGKKLNEARADGPTALERAISLRYPEIITANFPSWTERIDMNLVIMPDEFEVKMRRKVHMKPTDEGIPDVVIVERKIDTITIDSDSDFNEEQELSEPYNDETNVAQTPIIVQVKSEPPDINDSIDITEHPVVPRDKFQQAIEHLEFEEDRISTYDHTEMSNTGQIENDTVMPYITNVKGADDSDDTAITAPDSEDNIEINLETSRTEANDQEIIDGDTQESIVIEDEDENVRLSKVSRVRQEDQLIRPNQNFKTTTRPTADVIGDNIKAVEANNIFITQLVDNIIQETNEIMPIITSVTGGVQVQNKLERNTENYEKDTMESAKENLLSNLDIAREIVTETNFVDDADGIEFADDGIEEVDHNDSNEPAEPLESQVSEEAAPKFDLKLLMNPVVYTTKLDDMTVYQGKSVNVAIRSKDLVDKINLESKPVSDIAIKVEQIKADNQLLEAEKVNVENASVQEDFEDDLYQNKAINDENNLIDSKRVKLTNSLLQKPKSRSYNPIQLCKNPDFNMRLKRLTMGFFSHERNRAFLRECKPMTIDLSKAFESKLVNGTMYLKPSDSAIKTRIENSSVINESTDTVPPYLVKNPEVDKILQDELQKRMLERNKTINLPNISVVRKLNQQLLMAEVAPIMAQVEKTKNSQQITAQNVIETDVEKKSSDVNVSKHTNPPLPPAPNVVKRTSSMTNTDKSNEVPSKISALNLSVPVLPMLQNKDINTEKPAKKTKNLPRDRPGWLSKAPKEIIPTDANLTLDTLYKILNTMDPSCVKYNPKAKTKSAIKPVIVKECEVTDNNTEENAGLEKNLPKVADPQKIKYKRKKYCCWAKLKILKITVSPGNKLPRHTCKERCKCCCREALRKAQLDNEINMLEKMLNRDTLVETIEQVVQQSRCNSNQDKDSIPVTVRQSLNHINTQEPAVTLQIDCTSDVNNTSTNTEFENYASSSKTVVANDTIVLDDEDENIKDVAISEPGPETQIEVCPVPTFRVYAGPTRTPEKPKIADTQNNYTPHGDEDILTTATAATSPAPMIVPPTPILVPLTSLVQPAVIEPLVPETKITPVTMKSTSEKLVDTSVRQRNLMKVHREIAPKGQNFGFDAGNLPPCTCTPNVAQDQSSPLLVVDGSSNCQRHTTSCVSKETRIYLSRKHLSTTQRPFFVGKNKILLTNIKPPRLQKPAEPIVIVPQVTQLTPPVRPDTTQITLDIPEGLQIVILPDGSVSYVLEPNVQLTPEQIDVMPLILKMVKDDISATGITIPAHEGSVPESIISNSEDKEPPKSNEIIRDVENSNKPNQQLQENCHINKALPLSETKENDKSESIAPTEVEYTSKETNKENVVANILVEKDIDSALNVHTTGTDVVELSEENNRNETPTGSSRNLISDLMEMSGIINEDVSHTQPAAATLSALIEKTTESVATEQNAIASGLRPRSPQCSISAKVDQATYDLNPIVSFSELKYACENKGLFFKLDLNTGIIVPINVCIQKTPDTRPKTGAPDVIDLTDDSSTLENPKESFEMTNLESGSNNSHVNVVNVMSMKGKQQQHSNSKRVYNLMATINEKKAALIKKLSNNLKPLKCSPIILRNRVSLLRKNVTRPLRKQDIKNIITTRFKEKVNATINMVDSDSPMEEEYLEDFSDESDDEPLAKVAKKMRDKESQDNQQAEIPNVPEATITEQAVSESSSATESASIAKDWVDETIDDQIEETMESYDDSMDVDKSFETALHAVNIPVNSDTNMKGRLNIQPVPTQLMFSGPAVAQPILLNDALVNSDSEDSQDDCILGV